MDAILIRSATKVDAEALAAKNPRSSPAPASAWTTSMGRCHQQGVMVVNAPTSNIVSAAELAVALLLASALASRPLTQRCARASGSGRSTWCRARRQDRRRRGLGRIGLLVAQRPSAFGVNLVAYDPSRQARSGSPAGVRMVDLDELLAESDFITVHLPKTKETLGPTGDDALHKVKPTVHIVNAERGGIVTSRPRTTPWWTAVAGAGLDVHAKEPCTDSPLFGLDNVVATPHLGARPTRRRRRPASLG